MTSPTLSSTHGSMCQTRTDPHCAHIRRTFGAALPQLAGFDWYERANDRAVDVARGLGYTVEQVVGATAAISPMRSWEQNKIMVENLDWTGTYANNSAKADLILSGADPLDVLGGPKVRAFYRAILDPLDYNDAVVDRHTIGVYLGRQPTELERRRYGRGRSVVAIQSCFAKIAHEEGMFPHQLQAITWEEWRETVSQREN